MLGGGSVSGTDIVAFFVVLIPGRSVGVRSLRIVTDGNCWRMMWAWYKTMLRWVGFSIVMMSGRGVLVS